MNFLEQFDQDRSDLKLNPIRYGYAPLERFLNFNHSRRINYSINMITSNWTIIHTYGKT